MHLINEILFSSPFVQKIYVYFTCALIFTTYNANILLAGVCTCVESVLQGWSQK